jgi:hypothetical protein
MLGFDCCWNREVTDLENTRVNSSAAALTHARRESLFYGGMALALAITSFAGFAPTYYLKSYFSAQPPLAPLLQIHGLVFTLWMVLLVVQTGLIAANRPHVHRRTGIAGGLLAILMMILGGAVAITRARAGLLGPPGGPPPLVFLAIPMTTLLVFPALFGAALVLRNRADAHKRLALLATLEIVTAAVGRLPGMSALGPLAFFAVTDLFVIAIAINDRLTLGHVHRATLYGGLLLIASQVGRLLITRTATWLVIAHWLTR